MSTGSVQRRNDEMVSLLESDFCRWREFMADGARLLSAVQATHRQGGGDLRWGWMADSLFLHGQAAAAGNAFTGINVTSPDYFATANGGPYVDLDGATEYLDAGDRTWAEVPTSELLAWQWAYCDATTAANQMVVCKWDALAADQEWQLYYNNVAGNWSASVNDGVVRTATSTRVFSFAVWTFAALYCSPGNLLRIAVGRANDAVLTFDDAPIAPGSPINTGTASFTMGARTGPAAYFDGKIGVGNGRANVPQANVNGYLTRLFHMTRWKYMA